MNAGFGERSRNRTYNLLIPHQQQLLPCHPQLDHHPLTSFVINQEMAMEEKAAVFLKVCARDGLAFGTFGIERRGPQDNVLAVECAVALTNRHRRLPRVVPHGCEAIRLWIEAGDPGARALRSVRIEEREIGLQKLAVLDHVLLAGCFRDDGLAIRREERLHDVPLAHELREQLLTRARCVRWLVLIVGLLRDGRDCDEQNRCYPFPHGTR